MHFGRLLLYFGLLNLTFACKKAEPNYWQDEIISSLGNKYKMLHQQSIEELEKHLAIDSSDLSAHLGVAESNVMLFIFGHSPREQTIPQVRRALQSAYEIDSLDAEVQRMSGILSFLDWDWQNAPKAFQKAIRTNPTNLAARHWYALYLAAMGRMDESMAQSDTIMTMDPNEDYLIGRGSLLYFQHEFAPLRDLMLRTIARDSTLPWGYDWLGMAYNGLEDHQASIETYVQAFELSDGTVEVGAGLGHALGQGGEVIAARKMADYYAFRAKNDYLPPVQRSFIHLGLEEYDEALNLLEQAYDERSWFLIFIQIEPWYDPIRSQPRFRDLISKMKFPGQYRPTH